MWPRMCWLPHMHINVCTASADVSSRGHAHLCVCVAAAGNWCCWCCCAAVSSGCSRACQCTAWGQGHCADTLQHRWGWAGSGLLVHSLCAWRWHAGGATGADGRNLLLSVLNPVLCLCGDCLCNTPCCWLLQGALPQLATAQRWVWCVPCMRWASWSTAMPVRHAPTTKVRGTATGADLCKGVSSGVMLWRSHAPPVDE
jgi:hypothetical protein